MKGELTGTLDLAAWRMLENSDTSCSLCNRNGCIPAKFVAKYLSRGQLKSVVGVLLLRLS